MGITDFFFNWLRRRRGDASGSGGDRVPDRSETDRSGDEWSEETTDRRLIEVAFPLAEVSESSARERLERDELNGHIAALHPWPARSPLTASRGVILSTLLPGPGSDEERNRLLERMAGPEASKGDSEEEAVEKIRPGGILRWGKVDAEELDAFRKEIREAFGGRAPRVLDPFAGGGAIPLEAMRLGCEVEAADLNPVAWLLLRCALHYPKVVSGKRRLPASLAGYPSFEEVREQAQGQAPLDGAEAAPPPVVPFSRHFRVWGDRVFSEARSKLAARYPVLADFEPRRRKKSGRFLDDPRFDFEPRLPRWLEPDAGGGASVEALNEEFDADYLEEDRNPRWVAKPSVAYLWARTASCPSCREGIPLLKTRWLHRRPADPFRPAKRVLLTLTPRAGGSGVEFGLDTEVPEGQGPPWERREHDRALGAGTLSRQGATCPGCGAFVKSANLRKPAAAGNLGERMIAVVVEGQTGKEYLLPAEAEIEAAQVSDEELEDLYAGIPFGLPDEPTPESGVGGQAVSLSGYGLGAWRNLFTNRQLFTIGVLLREIRNCADEMDDYPSAWRESLLAHLAVALSRFADYHSALCSWREAKTTKFRKTFDRFALQGAWDYCEGNPLAKDPGGFPASLHRVSAVATRLAEIESAGSPSVRRGSASEAVPGEFDLICAEPPYYDAVPYSALMDFFRVWLRRALHGVSGEVDRAFASPTGSKRDGNAGDGELLDDPDRFDGDRIASKKDYEARLKQCFERFRDALRDGGRFVVVLPGEDSGDWDTLIASIIRSGFVVTASWPIQAEPAARRRKAPWTAFAPSVWLVCRKRSPRAPEGPDREVLRMTREKLAERLPSLWDAGIRGPDFLWAAIGPALESFSRHSRVTKTDRDRTPIPVATYCNRAWRATADFAAKRVIEHAIGESGETAVGGKMLDSLTTYYLLHRHDFGFRGVPAAACVFYTRACVLSVKSLTGRLNLLAPEEPRPADDRAEEEADTRLVSLQPWHLRWREVGELRADGQPPAFIDALHRAMWLASEEALGELDRYLEETGLAENELFGRFLRAMIEMAKPGKSERNLLESLRNQVPAFAAAPDPSEWR